MTCPCEHDAPGDLCWIEDPISGQACTRGLGHDGDHLVCGFAHGGERWPREPLDYAPLANHLKSIGRYEDSEERRQLGA